MDNEEMMQCWDSISKGLRMVVKRVERLPQWERDSEFDEWLRHALDHSESRADALLDPS